jgi:hypothetical protein
MLYPAFLTLQGRGGVLLFNLLISSIQAMGPLRRECRHITIRPDCVVIPHHSYIASEGGCTAIQPFHPFDSSGRTQNSAPPLLICTLQALPVDVLCSLALPSRRSAAGVVCSLADQAIQKWLCSPSVPASTPPRTWKTTPAEPKATPGR